MDAALPPGLIDIHSHLLPGIDDGCRTLDESLTAVRELLAHGFVGSICTPHIWPQAYPGNAPTHIARWTTQLQRHLREAGLDYRLWPGGEVRLHASLIDDFEAQGVPTLANSRCVLVDMWEDGYPKWADPIFTWLLEHEYQPIFAHPERLNCPKELQTILERLRNMGVWLQGNFRCLTGEEGYYADRFVRQFLADEWYTFMALDMHDPLTLPGRFDGIELFEREIGREELEKLTSTAPRALLLAPRE